MTEPRQAPLSNERRSWRSYQRAGLTVALPVAGVCALLLLVGISPPASAHTPVAGKFPLVYTAPFSASVTNSTLTLNKTACSGSVLTQAPVFNSTSGKGGFAGSTTATPCSGGNATVVSAIGFTVGIYTDNPRQATSVFLNWSVAVRLTALLSAASCSAVTANYSCTELVQANLTASAQVTYATGNSHNFTWHVAQMGSPTSFSLSAWNDTACNSTGCTNSSSPSAGQSLREAVASAFHSNLGMGHRSIHVTFTVIGYLVCEFSSVGAVLGVGSASASLNAFSAPSGVVVHSETID